MEVTMDDKKVFELSEAKQVIWNGIITKDPFRELFPADEKKVHTIAEHMKVRGYDKSQPVILWNPCIGKGFHKYVLIDGHQRCQAAGRAWINTLWPVVVKFKDEQEALS
jgi:hypothetical protein